MHALPASLYQHNKVNVADLSSMSGDAIWLHAHLLALVNCKAVVLVLCNTLVLYCRTLACGACTHALTATLYLHSQVVDLSSISGHLHVVHSKVAVLRSIAA
ncbi:hypothetical protein ABBQ38_005823 [Trebouxia sp. C0009 RCD-2024]